MSPVTQEMWVEGIEIKGEFPDSYETVLTTPALRFVAELVRQFAPRRLELLGMRKSWKPGFLDETRKVRAGDWVVSQVPEELLDRRVEITGPVDRKMVINALNSGAQVFMADFEDSNAPTWANVVEGQINLRDAIAGTIEFTNPKGKQYSLNEKTAVLFVRPRGWHLEEKNILVDGKPAPASLVDFGLFFYHNAKKTRPFFYLPKLESHLEARLWNDVFLAAQEKLGLPRGTVKATVLIETLPAAFQMDEILYELREHSAGLNCGRWDYIFSFIKNNPDVVLPNRAQITMDKAFLKAYVDLLIQTCHRRGVHAMGGMAAQIPIKNDEEANTAALDKVRKDKLREVEAGHDGTWVAHPGLVPIALEAFTKKNQLDVQRDVSVTEADLLAVPEGEITEEGLRRNIDVGVLYLDAWLKGNGCVPLYHQMEDAATAEICRTQVWQWLRHGKVKKEVVRKLLAERTERRAAEIFEEFTFSPECSPFMTLRAYEVLEEGGEA